MAKDKINVSNLDTLDIKAKKKKNFIIVSIIVVIVTMLFISIGSAFLKVDKTKMYKEREKAEAAKDLKVIQNPEFKENWAISIENRMESQEKKTQEVIAEIAGKQDRVLDELKGIIKENSQKSSNEIQELSTSFDTKINSLRNELFEQIEGQNQKIEQVSVLAQSSKSSSPNSGDIMIGSDLTPKNNVGATDQNGLTIVVAEGDKKDKEKKEADSKELEKAANEAAKNAQGTTIVPNAIEETVITPNQSKKKSIKMVDIDTSFNANIVAAAAQIEDDAKDKDPKKEADKNYHLSTGLSQAYMITGAYAPAFQEGEAEPLPVLFEAEGQIIQPNDHLASVDKCFLLGSAKGNMNSQTANIKLVSISCILNEGEYRIEGAISGWVIGENGIPGVHGELIHKNGAWLARTFVSGFLETFANAIGGGNTSTINLGTDTTTNGSSSNSRNQVGTGTSINNNLATAGAQGISTVFNKLGDYYLKMAEQIFPVIEVRGGRTVDLLLIGGEDLTIVENNKVDLANINDHLSELSLKKDKEEDKITNTNPFTKSILKDSGKGQASTSENEVPGPMKK